MNGTPNTDAGGDEIRRQELVVKQAELEIKRAELQLREAEHKRGSWRSPLVIAIIAAAVAAIGNAGVTYYDAVQQRILDENIAENERILSMITIGEPSQVQRNLEFLIEAGLIVDQTKISSIQEYYHSRDAGTGPGANFPSTTAERLMLYMSCTENGGDQYTQNCCDHVTRAEAATLGICSG